MTALNVLLVEDDPDIRALLRFCLEDDARCAKVVEATSPQEAVQAAAAEPFEVMLLDYMLTGGTASDCLPRLRTLHPNAWIVVYTANRAAAAADDVVRQGANRLIEKVGVTVDELVATALGRSDSR